MSGRREFWRGHHRFTTGIHARCATCGVTVTVWGGFYLGTNAIDPQFRRETRCPRCYALPAVWIWEEGSEADITIFRAWEPPDYWPACDICGKRRDDLAAVATVVNPAHILRVCRHGHFQGETVDPHTGLPTNLTGPKMLDSLIYFPEGFVPWMKRDLWAEVVGS